MKIGDEIKENCCLCYVYHRNHENNTIKITYGLTNMVTRNQQKINDATQEKIVQKKQKAKISYEKATYKQRKKISKQLKSRIVYPSVAVLHSQDHDVCDWTRRIPHGQKKIVDASKVSIVDPKKKDGVTLGSLNHLMDVKAEEYNDFLKRSKNGDIGSVDKFYSEFLSKYIQWNKILIEESETIPTIHSFKESEQNQVFQMYFASFPYVHVAKSIYKERDFGLFASRQFKKNDRIGIYLGYKQSKKFSCYRLKSVDVELKRSFLYMGIHFINDPYLDMENGLINGKEPEEHPNVYFTTDYLCIARRDIEKNEELLVEYGWNS